MQDLFQSPTSTYRITKLKTLPLRDQPAYRVTSNAAACNLAELLAAVVGGTQQIEIAEGLADSGHIAHPFRSYPHTHSGVIRTLIPG